MPFVNRSLTADNICIATTALLYFRALRAQHLRLDEIERLRTRQEITSHVMLAATGLASALAAAVLPTKLGVWAGFVYMTLPITMPVTAIRRARQADRLRATIPSES